MHLIDLDIKALVEHADSQWTASLKILSGQPVRKSLVDSQFENPCQKP